MVQRFCYSSSHTLHQILGTNISTIVHSANLRRNSPISAASSLDCVKFSVCTVSCLLLPTYSVGYNLLSGLFNRVIG